MATVRAISFSLVTSAVLSLHITGASAHDSQAPLAHTELADRDQISLTAGGVTAEVRLVQEPDCDRPILLNDGGSPSPAACRMARLTVSDSNMPGRAPFTADLTPYSRDGSDVRDLQLDIRRLDSHGTTPQVLVSVYTGGAHCCALTSIVGTTADGSWTASSPSALSGEDRPLLEDIDGDGAQEIIAADLGFLYTFASHAGSYTPDIVYRYTAGRLVNISTDPVARPFLEKRLHENEGFWTQQNRSEPNGFLSYYVAMKALTGQFPAGWSYMLPRYDHDIDPAFSLSLCALGGRIESDCTPEEQQPLAFPQALAGFLVGRRYVSQTEALASVPDAKDSIAAATRYRPDFSCMTPPQHNGVAQLLCRDSEAAKHQLQFDQVYYALRQIVGEAGWKGLKQNIVLAENDADRRCGLPVPGADDQTVPPDAAGCRNAALDRLAETYRVKLSGPALEESKRPIDRHIALQERLIALGYLPPDASADGVYGEATRAAIAQWHKDTKHPELSAFLSDTDAAILLGEAPPTQPVPSPKPATQTPTPETSAVIQEASATWTVLGFSFATAMLLLAMTVTLYFIPSVISCLRDTERKPAVFATNFFLGWTVIGWLAAMYMAFSFKPQGRIRQ